MAVFEPTLLPEREKEYLCRQLLMEFGITDIRQHGDELVHACLISSYHQDQARNPTASLNFHKLTYNCLGCDSSGGLLWFIATVRGENTDRARDWLEKETGTGGQAQDPVKWMQFLNAVFTESKAQAPIPKYSPRLLEPWMFIHPAMTDGAPEVNLKGRHIPEQTLIDFKVGWERDRDRIVIPHFWKGDLVGWLTRRIWDDGSEKYLNSPDFPKDFTLYNAPPKGRRAPRRLLVVESSMSVLRHVHALPMVGTFGAKITDVQLRLLEGYDGLVFWMDNDKAGWKATEKLIEHHSRTNPCWVVDNPFTADPGDLPTEAVLELVADAVPCGQWRRPDPDSLIKWEEVA